MIKVLMMPHLSHFRSEESGIKRVCEAYHRHLGDYGIELVLPDATTYDIKVAHAGMAGGDCDVAMLHGLYWTGDYEAAAWEWKANQSVIASIRGAKQVTVPSAWVAETLKRDMHLSPHVIGHGIDWAAWQHTEPNEGYVLGYSKNRVGDACDPTFMTHLANRFPQQRFLGTFATVDAPPNVKVTGLVKHSEMREMVQRSSVYVSVTKETFGIGTLEAMAAGIPVLGFRYGGNVDLVQHGVNGYLARPGNLEDLAQGLDYCLKHRKTLGANGREMAKRFTWEAVCSQVADVYRLATCEEPATVGIVIPCFNKEDTLERAVRSALEQTYPVERIVIVDDGSTDGSEVIGSILADEHERVTYLRIENSGVAVARNTGIGHCDSTYIACLDADDWIAPRFIEACVAALEEDRTLGIAYTRLMTHMPDGSQHLSAWPGKFDYDAQLRRKNQVPCCAVFRREAWLRSGGYRSRYCVNGAGTEDAAFWTHLGALGYGAVLATEEPLFHYSAGSGHTSRAGYREPDWLQSYPWVGDGLHPFASIATPKRQSHAVRQYDEPVVSVIIPVGPGHENILVDALDSLEAQTFRKWEAIVVWDCDSDWSHVKTAYPFARIQVTMGGVGAGKARNIGVRESRAPFICFLDADDYLLPTALEQMLDAWNETEVAVYSDYIGKATVDDVEKLAPNLRENLLEYNLRSKEATIRYHAVDYDCERALRQPENPPYLWCNVTTLLPKAWHDAIGGFDEEMDSWEDVDYFYRLARAGRCFVRIPEPLMVYRFHSGMRRETGLQSWENLIQFMQDKYRKEKAMPCNGCGGKRTVTPPVAPPISASRSASVSGDGDFVKVRLSDGNRGDHPIIGPATKTRYGYRSDGDVFLVHKADIAARPGAFTPVVEGVRVPEVAAEAPPEPESIVVEPFDPSAIPGMTAAIVRVWPAGLNSRAAILGAGLDGLTAIKGVGKAKAEAILEWAHE